MKIRSLINTLSFYHFFFNQGQLECSKRGWELQQLKKKKEEEEEQELKDSDEDLFTYTREDAYNMVGGLCDLNSFSKNLWLVLLVVDFIFVFTGVCV